MDYSNYTREQLLQVIDELEILNKQLLREREQEDRLDFAWTGNLGHWYFNIRTNSIVFNPMKVEAMGYSINELPEKVTYQFFTEKLHPDDYEVAMEAMRQNLYGKSDVYECEYRILTKDGSWKWFYDRGKVTMRDQYGKPEFAAGIVFDITEKKEREKRLENERELLEEKSSTDMLTGIRNHGAILDELKVRIKQARDNGTPLSITMLDIDKFKVINDTKGHVFGDKVIRDVADNIISSIRDMDAVGRYGGEEFLLVLPNTPLSYATFVCERIRANIEDYDFGEGVRVTVSGGVAEYGLEELVEFVDRADKKLYLAKNSGRNKIEG